MLLALLLGCSTVTPGHVTVAVHLTAAEADRYEVLRGGRYWWGFEWNTDYYDLPTMEQRAVWAQAATEGNPVDESITFAGRDGQPVNVDIGVGYALGAQDAEIIEMIRTYGLNLDQTLDTRVRDSARNALNLCAAGMTVEDIYGEQKGALMDCATDKVRAEFSDHGLHVVRMTLNSEIRLPPKVKDAMADALAATQRATQARNEVETTKAEGEKRIAAAQADAEATRLAAEAQANADKLRAGAITAETLRIQELEIQRLLAEKWDGKLPTSMPPGSAVPLIQLPHAE